ARALYLLPLFWVRRVPQAVAKKIESQNEERDRNARKQRQVWRVQNMRAAAVEHRPPAWRGRLDTEAQEAERSFADDCAGHAERGLHDDNRYRRRHDVTKQHARRRCSERSRRLHVLELACP